eukprot:1033271-Rhodomonas_salina.3
MTPRWLRGRLLPSRRLQRTDEQWDRCPLEEASMRSYSSDAEDEEWEASVRREEVCEASSPDQTASQASPGLPFADFEPRLDCSAQQHQVLEEEDGIAMPAANPDEHEQPEDCGHVTPGRGRVTPAAPRQPLKRAHAPLKALTDSLPRSRRARYSPASVLRNPYVLSGTDAAPQ